MENVSDYWSGLVALAMAYIPKLLLALVTLVIGIWLVKKIARSLRRFMERRRLDPSVVPFLSTIASIGLYVMLFLSVAGMVGIETTSFIAALGAAGLAIGLALQGSLANFAGGVMLLIFKPFRVNDVIEAQGVIAQVMEIQIFHTILKTYDNKTIYLPNGPLHNDKIINYSTEKTRTVEWIFEISYGDSIDKARDTIRTIVYSDPRTLNKNAPFINVSELGQKGVALKVRAEANGGDYWGLFFDVNEKIKKAFDREGITIPLPQTDVRLYNVNK